VINARQLQIFLVLAEELHFGRAAERLHVAQPALTQTLRLLEADLGVRLFDRTTRRVQLSDAGRAIHDEAVRVRESMDAIRETTRRIAAGEAGTLRIGYMIGAGIDIMPALFARFRELYPLVAVETREFDFGDPSAGLASGAVDAAIIRPPVGGAAISFEPLAREPRVVTLPAAHRLASRASVRLDEILGEPIVAAPASAGIWRDYWIALDRRHGTPPLIGAEAATREAELQLVAMGRGISITSGAAALYYARPGVCFVEIDDLEPCVVALAWPSERCTPIVENLRAVAHEVAADALRDS
jgi:DNA-binding transcriptional LysR family regulator